MFRIVVALAFVTLVVSQPYPFDQGSVTYSVWLTSSTCSGSPRDSFTRPSPSCIGFVNIQTNTSDLYVYACDQSNQRMFPVHPFNSPLKIFIVALVFRCPRSSASNGTCVINTQCSPMPTSVYPNVGKCDALYSGSASLYHYKFTGCVPQGQASAVIPKLFILTSLLLLLGLIH